MIDSEFILESLDNLVRLGSETALEFGWLANQYFESEKANLISEFGTETAALHETISFLHDREAAYIVARSTVADRMRVTRYVTREMYSDVLAENPRHRPSFHQLRACLITENGVVVKDATDEMLNWCISNEWPTVAEIREHRDGVDPTSLADRRWNRIVVLCKRAEMDEDQPIGRFTALCSVIDQDTMERNA